VNSQRLEANSEAVWPEPMSQLREIDHFRFFGFSNLSGSQRTQLSSTSLKDLTLYRGGRIELRFKLTVNGELVADTIAVLSASNVSYDEVAPIGRDSPV
jgi:hypothetical protein